MTGVFIALQKFARKKKKEVIEWKKEETSLFGEETYCSERNSVHNLNTYNIANVERFFLQRMTNAFGINQGKMLLCV